MGATTTETLIFAVDIVRNDARLAELAKEAREAKEEIDKLKAGVKAGTVEVSLLDSASAKYKNTMAANSQETRMLTAANLAQATANKATAGSVDELTAKSNLLTLQVNALSAEQKKTEGGKVLVTQLKAVNDELIKQGAAVSDGRRNIGNYEAALKNASLGAKDLTGGLKTASDTALKPFQGLIDKGTGLFAKYKSGTDLVQKGLAGLQPAGETGSLGLKAIGVGITLTGIGLFIIALTAVIGYFTQTNEGGKILKQGLAGLGAVVTTVANLFTGAGKSLVEAFKNPRVALDSLLNFLKSQVVNRLAAFGVLIDGIRNRDFKKITDSVIQFNLGITNGTDKAAAYAASVGKVVVAAADLEAQQQKLKKSRAELEVDEVKEKGRVEELIRLSKDRTLSASDRLNKLREAGKKEEELSAKSLDQINKELALLQQRNKARGLSVTSDEIQEERDKRKEYNATVAERNSTLATIKARESRFILEEAAELKKAQADRATAAQKAKEDAIRAKITEQKELLLTVEQGSAAELAVKQRIVQLEADLDAAAAKKTADEKKLIQGNANLAIQKLADEFADKMTEAERKRIEARRKEAQREYGEAQKNLNDYLDRKRAQVESDYAEGLIGENQYQKDLNAINKAGYDAELINAKDYAQDLGAIQKKQAENEIKERNRVKNEKKKIKTVEEEITDNTLQAGLKASDLLIKALGEETEAGQVAVAIKKTLALTEIGINLQRQLANNALTGSDIAKEVPPPLGIALGAAYVISSDALAIATAAEAAANVLGFNTGGKVPGQGNTDSVVAKLTPGELVMTKAVGESELAPVLGYLNSLYGGVNFAPGFTPKPTGQIDGGLVARNVAYGAYPTAAEIGAAVAANVPTSIAVDEISRAQGRKARVRSITSLR